MPEVGGNRPVRIDLRTEEEENSGSESSWTSWTCWTSWTLTQGLDRGLGPWIWPLGLNSEPGPWTGNLDQDQKPGAGSWSLYLEAWHTHIVVVFPAPLCPKKEVICPS